MVTEGFTKENVMDAERLKEVQEEVEELILTCLESVVTVPDAVVVKTKMLKPDHMEAEVQVEPVDVGLAIGKQGAVARAIGTLLACIGGREKMGMSYEVLQPNGSRRARPENRA